MFSELSPAVSAGRDPAVDVRNVSKCFNIYERPHHRLLQGLCRSRRFFSEFWALRDVTFAVRPGEVIGIVGRNGSGKSTLLQVICGTLTPTAGSVRASGRVSALLELGAGFNPEFTGRENVYMNGAILGLEKAEIDEKFDAIAAFADVGEFMEHPVKTYSSGMYVRLAFSVAACLDPDVLIIDEALAVGDAKFQAKCFRRFDELTARGTTIIFVTHALDLVTRYCDRAILMDAGRLQLDGAPRDVVNAYLNLVFGVARADRAAKASSPRRTASESVRGIAYSDRGFSRRPGYNPHEFRWGSQEAEIIDFAVTTGAGVPTAALVSGEEMFVIIWVKFHHAAEMPIYGLTIKTPDGTTVFGSNSRDNYSRPLIRPVADGDLVEVSFRVKQELGAGEYLLSVGVSRQQGEQVIPLDRRYDAIHVAVQNHKSGAFGLVAFDMEVEIHEHEIHA
jgi:lipopolysaccharide transport system ATP-binding protein